MVNKEIKKMMKDFLREVHTRITSQECGCMKSEIIDIGRDIPHTIKVIGEHNIYCAEHDDPTDINNVTAMAKEYADKIYKCLNYHEEIKVIPVVEKHRTCKICNDNMPILNFSLCNSKKSPDSRKHICIDCEKEERKKRNKQYYEKRRVVAVKPKKAEKDEIIVKPEETSEPQETPI